jgi:hypothetical protein
MIWKKFPETAPDSRRILVGGWTLPIGQQDSRKGIMVPDEWIEIIASYNYFCSRPFVACQDNQNPDRQWITEGFQLLDSFNVSWEYWTHLPLSPNRFE